MSNHNRNNVLNQPKASQWTSIIADKRKWGLFEQPRTQKRAQQMFNKQAKVQTNAEGLINEQLKAQKHAQQLKDGQQTSKFVDKR